MTRPVLMLGPALLLALGACAEMQASSPRPRAEGRTAAPTSARTGSASRSPR